MRELRIEIGQSTDVGRKRTVNEDNLGLLVPPESGLRSQIGALFVVADGMGGHAKGEVASALAITTLTQSYLSADAPSLEDRLATALRQANAAIWDEAGRALIGADRRPLPAGDRGAQGGPLVGRRLRLAARRSAVVGLNEAPDVARLLYAIAIVRLRGARVDA